MSRRCTRAQRSIHLKLAFTSCNNFLPIVLSRHFFLNTRIRALVSARVPCNCRWNFVDLHWKKTRNFWYINRIDYHANRTRLPIMVGRNRKRVDKAVSKKRKRSSDAAKRAKRPRGKWIAITSSLAKFCDPRNPESSDVLFHDIDRIDTLFALSKFHSVLSRRSIATWSRKVAFFAPKRRRNEI